jgi:hypothetical protein
MLALRRLALVAVAGLLACSPGTAATTTTSPGTTTTAMVTTTSATVPTTTTTVAPTTTVPPAEQTVQVLLQPFSQLGPEWSEILLPYGEAEDQLGTAPGGDGLMLGPEYGTQTPDGKWWMLDAAKQRAAVYEADATFDQGIPFPEEVLVDGQYFQFQMPQALDDGSIAATGFRSESASALLRIVDDEMTSTDFPGTVAWVTTDGTYLYGLSFEDGQPYRLDPQSPTAEPREVLTTRAGTSYTAVLQDGEVLIGLPDLGITRTLQLRYSEDPEVAVFGGIEVDSGADGTLFVLIYGAPESEESLGVGGFLSISPHGVVGEVEPIRDPFSPADPGTPAHLGVTPLTATPWLMMIDEDGARIYTRAG